MFYLDRWDVGADVCLQRLDVLVDVHLGPVDEEVDVDEVEATSRAQTDEVVEVRQSRLASAVGHCWGAKLDGAVIRLQVSLVHDDAVD